MAEHKVGRFAAPAAVAPEVDDDGVGARQEPERVDGNLLMGAAVGVGPVDTLNMALRDALVPIYPFLLKIKLTDYRVRVLNPEQATAARVRVFITTSDGEESWDTVGVSENVIEASWQALIDSMEFYYDNRIAEGADGNGVAAGVSRT